MVEHLPHHPIVKGSSSVATEKEKVKIRGGRKPTYLTSVLTSAIAVSLVPSGGKMDVRRANTNVRWVGFHRLKNLRIISSFAFNYVCLKISLTLAYAGLQTTD